MTRQQNEKAVQAEVSKVLYRLKAFFRDGMKLCFISYHPTDIESFTVISLENDDDLDQLSKVIEKAKNAPVETDKVEIYEQIN